MLDSEDLKINEMFTVLKTSFLDMERENEGKKGRTSSFLIRYELVDFSFFVKNKIQIIVKLIIVSQPFYFTHKKIDAQRQTNFFQVRIACYL